VSFARACGLWGTLSRLLVVAEGLERVIASVGVAPGESVRMWNR
jgi:hypothetical protein